VDSKSHWERVYQTKRADEVSWYRPHLEISLELIAQAAPASDAHIVDIGGGESTLIDDLLARGYCNLSVLDISATALTVAEQRLGTDAAKVAWLCGDVTNYGFRSHQYDVWHDRAVFHFLTQVEDRAAYVRQVVRAVKPGGYVIVAAFGPEGQPDAAAWTSFDTTPILSTTSSGPDFDSRNTSPNSIKPPPARFSNSSSATATWHPSLADACPVGRECRHDVCFQAARNLQSVT
jgi:ubiquinone/menaquinone biosynthesis C-methylase UbiE